MTWEINQLPQRRSEPERIAYVQGFKAGVGMVRKYLAEDKPLEAIDLLVETLEEVAAMADQPRYEHDCEACTYLGYVEDQDAYVCPQAGTPTVILRRSSNGPDYDSGRHLLDILPDAMRKRAVKLMSDWLRAS